MPAKDINVRRETSRRCYRKKVAAEKALIIEKKKEKNMNENVFRDIAYKIKTESYHGWVSPQRVMVIVNNHMGKFNFLSKEEVVREVEFRGYLWYVSDVGAFMGSVPFLAEGEPFEYFKKRVPRTQKSSIKAELLILTTMIKFIKKGYHVKVFNEQY